MTDNLLDILRVGERAAARHKRKVIDALRKAASALLVTEDVVTASGGKTVKVRIRVLENPTFRFDHHDEVNVALGKEAKPGDILFSEEEVEGDRSGAGQGGGNGYTVEMSVDELIEMLMEEWQLPRFEANKRHEVLTEDYTMSDISTKGPMNRVHRKRTLKNAIKRAVATGDELLIHNDDLRFKSPRVTTTRSSNAVIVLLRDRSGSMGEFEMKASRMAAIWLVQFLRHRYDRVVIRFVLHDFDAAEVDEHTFYNVTSGGGTSIANGYRFCRKVLEEYPPADWNQYVVHFSDGDDWDVEDSIKEWKEILPRLQAFVYYELNAVEGEHFSEFWGAIDRQDERFSPNFMRYGITDIDDVRDALKTFLGQQL